MVKSEDHKRLFASSLKASSESFPGMISLADPTWRRHSTICNSSGSCLAILKNRVLFAPAFTPVALVFSIHPRQRPPGRTSRQPVRRNSQAPVSSHAWSGSLLNLSPAGSPLTSRDTSLLPQWRHPPWCPEDPSLSSRRSANSFSSPFMTRANLNQKVPTPNLPLS